MWERNLVKTYQLFDMRNSYGMEVIRKSSLFIFI